MQSITTVTQKGQITILEEFRKLLGIKPYGTVRLEIASDHVKVYPVKTTFFDLAGKFKIPKGKSVLEAREAMEKTYKRF